MYYTSTDRETLDAYNDKVVAGENYDGTTTVRWADVIEHHEGGMFAILKHSGYALIDASTTTTSHSTLLPLTPSLTSFHHSNHLTNDRRDSQVLPV